MSNISIRALIQNQTPFCGHSTTYGTLRSRKVFMITQTLSEFKHSFLYSHTVKARIARMACLSWLYALCSQIIIPLPFNLVPLSSQPGPVFLAAVLFGWEAVGAYILYIAQGACGAPFFAGFGSSFLYLLGPTGGYLLGFLAGMIFLVASRKYIQKNWLTQLVGLMMAWIIAFSCGLAQLAFFVPAHKLLVSGLFPFIIGDFGIKLGAVWKVLRITRR